MNKRILSRLLLSATFAGAANVALAEDIDIFSQNQTIQTGAPNVLIVLDDTANWSQSFDGSTKFAAEKTALATIVNALTAQFNLGIEMYTETGSPNNNVDGGYIRFAIQSMTDTSGNATNARNCLLKMVGNTTVTCTSSNTYYSNLDITNDKSNGGKAGKTMGEAYYYFSGSNAYAGSNKVKADPLAFGPAPNGGATNGSAPYYPPTSTGECAKNFIIVISNGPFQDNSSDTATAMSQLGTAGGDTTIINPPDTSSNNNAGDEWTRFLNKSSVGAITYTLEVGPSTTGQGPYNTALLQSMGTQGKGGYFSAISAADLLAKLNRIFNDILAKNSVFASSSLPLSADNTGNFSNQVYMGVFRPDGGGLPRWVGNLKEYQFAADSNGVLTLVDATNTPAASSQSGFAQSGAQSFWTSKDTTTAPDAAAAAATSAANGSTGGFWYFDSKGDGGSYDLPDGEWVEKGGAAEQLRLAYLGYGGRGGIGDTNTSTLNSKAARKVYTCTSTCLTASSSTGALLSSYSFDSNNSDVTADPTTFSINPVAVSVTSISSDRAVTTITAGTALPSVSSLKVTGGNLSTVTTSKKHNLPNGTSYVTISGSSIAGTNGTFLVTNTGNTTFTYPVTASSGTATGTITATSASTTATLSFSLTHGFSNGSTVKVSGATCPTGPAGSQVDPCSAFNGSSFTVSSKATLTFNITLASPGVGATANTGTIYASEPIARATTASAHGYSVGDSVTIAGASCSPTACTAYNTTATVTLLPTTTTFDYVYSASTPLPQALSSVSAITASDNTPSTSTLTTLLKWVRGQDTQNENNFQVAGANTDVRASIHGDVLHSRPTVINYAATGAASDDPYVFYGGNDGVFRAVKGGQASTDGKELWAFIPTEFFPILKRQYDDSPPIQYPTTPSGLGATHRNYAWDGPVATYITRDSSGNLSKALLFISVRRGGRFMYALDVTNHDAPKFLWRRGCYSSGTCDTGYSEIGQTWSTPTVALFQATDAGNGTTPVLIFGGGYDATSEDAEPPATADTMGRAVYFVNALTGDVLWSVGKQNTTVTDSRLTFAFTADVLAVDRHQTGFIDRVYAADIGGNLWRIDTSGTTTGSWSIHNIASVGGRTSTSAGRKFMFGPDMVVTQAGTFDAIVIGSGDREHPLASSTDAANASNRAYMFVDPNVNTTGTDLNITESDLAAVDTTTTTPVDLTGKEGWFVALRSGEKVINGPIVVASDMIFGTNQPCASGKTNAAGDCDSSGTNLTCTGNLGIARRYDINFLTAAPAGFTDTSGSSVRSEIAPGGGFLPSPVAGEVNINGTPYTFITDNPLSPGGVITPTITVSKTRFRTYWHEILE